MVDNKGGGAAVDKKGEGQWCSTLVVLSLEE